MESQYACYFNFKILFLILFNKKELKWGKIEVILEYEMFLYRKKYSQKDHS